MMNLQFSIKPCGVRSASKPDGRITGLTPYRFAPVGRHPWPFAANEKQSPFMFGTDDRPMRDGSRSANNPLTKRQLECLAWISQGKSSTDIGAILNISGRTVDYHVGEICRRLDVRTRMQAVAYALQQGWLRA